MKRSLNIDKLITGDEAAWAAMLRLYGGFVYGICRRVLRDDEEAEDATQETFVRAYRSISGFQKDAPIRPWLGRIAWNHSLRVAAGRSRGCVVMENPHLPESSSLLPDPAQAAQGAQLKKRLEKAMADLPGDQRVIMELRCGSNMGYREIAQTLGLPIGTVKRPRVQR